MDDIHAECEEQLDSLRADLKLCAFEITRLRKIEAAARMGLAVAKEFATTLTDNQCVDYHVCCGVASDLEHNSSCTAMNAIAALSEALGEKK